MEKNNFYLYVWQNVTIAPDQPNYLFKVSEDRYIA